MPPIEDARTVHNTQLSGFCPHVRTFEQTRDLLDLYGRKLASNQSEKRTTGDGPLEGLSTEGQRGSKLGLSFAQDARASKMEFATRHEGRRALGCRNTTLSGDFRCTRQTIRHLDTATDTPRIAQHSSNLECIISRYISGNTVH